MAKKNTYDESNIQILEGLEAVRKRPGMYIGSTDSRGLHHLVWEIVDNAIDEALSGYGNLIEVTICKDNSIMVQDHGRGMPTGMHASGRPTTEVILTILHAGGKFSEDGGYKTSGGLHGVGASVVNALSHWLEVTVCRDGKIFKQRFEDGGETIGKLTVIGKTKETGTLIHFLPNDQIFSTIEFNYKTISERLMESAFLLKGIKIVLKDERTGKMDEFHFENGLEAFIDYLNTNKDVLHPTISIEGEQNGMEVDIALQFTSGYQETTLSFVNLVRTDDGGTHETGFKSGLTKTFNDYARKYGLLKEKDKNLEGNDVREGLSAIISIKVPEHYLQFEGQTKSKLGTPEARNIVDSIVYEKLSYFLEENKEIADNLVKKMIKAAQVRDAARKAREAARKGKGARQERILSGKLAPAQTKNKKKNELYLVEGDSAGGSAKMGRDRRIQAILPLRGKILNVEKARLDRVLSSDTIRSMITAFGTGIGEDFDINKLRYHKIVIMTDADVDGGHIRILMLTFLYRYLKPLIEGGFVYAAQPPLYLLKHGKEEHYLYSDEELDDLRTKLGEGAKYSIQRYKGLGEMNADQLWETTMDPEHRILNRIELDEAMEADMIFDVLMGEKVEPRREFIQENAKYVTDLDI